MIDSIRAAGTASYRHFSTARELERLLVDDLAVLLSESFADATISIDASRIHRRLGRSSPTARSCRPGR